MYLKLFKEKIFIQKISPKPKKKIAFCSHVHFEINKANKRGSKLISTASTILIKKVQTKKKKRHNLNET